MFEKLAQRLERLAAHDSARWAFFCVTALAATWPYVVTAGAFNDFRDANVLWLYEDSARRSVVEFGQLPLWNPDFCGGLPALGTPQSRFASPTFLFTLLFGTTRAEPVITYFMVVVALGGAHLYTRLRGASQFAATLAAPVFGLMGIFACAPFLGWFNFLGFAWLPWVLAGTRLAARGRTLGVVLVACCTACMVGFGGTYVAPISLVACALEVALLAFERRGRLSLLTLSSAVLLALGGSAFRLWPVFDELQRAPRLVAGLSSQPLNALGAHLFGAAPLFGSETWYLVGIPAPVIAGLALLRRRSGSLLVGVGVWLWLAAGHAATPSLYAGLRRLPLFSMLRNSERFLVPAALLVAVGAAIALTTFQAQLRRPQRSKRARTLAAAGWALSTIGLIATVPWLSANFAIAAGKRELTAPPQVEQRPFHQARGNRWAAASFGPMSRGSLACWEAYAVPQSPKLRGDLEREMWLADASAGAVDERSWSPGRLDFHVSLSRPTRLLVNQNHHVGWRSSVGTVVSDEGLLAVELPPGEHEVRLRFLPFSVIGGGAVSLLALIALWWLARRPRAAWQWLSSSLAPLALGVALVMTTPASPRAPARGPEGERLEVDELPEGAKALAVRFAQGVTLEGVRLEYRKSDDRVRLELDWSHLANVNPRLGFFVHVEPGTKKRITADHLQISDSVFLEELTAGRIGRDIMLLDVPDSKRDEPWNVWVGVWEMRGNGERVSVLDANGAQVEDARVLVGTLAIPPR